MRSASPLATVLAACALCVGAGSALAQDPPPNGGQRESIEELLERAKKQRAAIQEKLKGDVQGLVKEFESGPEPRKLAELVDKVVALGPEATPLLVRYVDPGDGATDSEKLRATQMANALSQMDTNAVTSDLLKLLSKSSSDAKRNALRVLQHSPEPDRVRGPVATLFRSAEGNLKQAALRTLLALGGPEVDAILGEVLGGADENLISIAIEGLASNGSESAVEQVRKILAQPNPAARHALVLLGYFKANRKLVKDSDLLAFVRIAQQAAVPIDTRIAVIDGLAELEPKVNTEFRKAMEPISGAADRRLRESGLVLLARLGDKNAFRELEKEYDDVVAKNEKWADAYVRRADMYAKVGKDDDAIKDYKEAITVGKDDPTFQADTYVKLAAALVRKGDLKEAADTLVRAPIGSAQLRQLADDPRFVTLRASKYAKRAFGLRDE